MAVLFGSYIYGIPREDSDFDIVFFVDKINEDTDYLTLLVNLNKLARQIDSRIEPHVFDKKDETGFGRRNLTTEGTEVRGQKARSQKSEIGGNTELAEKIRKLEFLGVKN